MKPMYRMLPVAGIHHIGIQVELTSESPAAFAGSKQVTVSDPYGTRIELKQP